jgi:hypothetical protein
MWLNSVSPFSENKICNNLKWESITTLTQSFSEFIIKFKFQTKKRRSYKKYSGKASQQFFSSEIEFFSLNNLFNFFVCSVESGELKFLPSHRWNESDRIELTWSHIKSYHMRRRLKANAYLLYVGPTILIETKKLWTNTLFMNKENPE